MKREYKILISLAIGLSIAILVIINWSKNMHVGIPQYSVASLWIIAPTTLTAVWTKSESKTTK